MANKETSSERAAFWTLSARKLRPGARVRNYDPSKRLRDPEFVKKAALEALADGDAEAVATILRAHLRVLNRSKTATRMGLSRQSLHRIIAGSRNPSLPTLGAFMRLLKSEQAGAYGLEKKIVKKNAPLELLAKNKAALLSSRNPRWF